MKNQRKIFLAVTNDVSTDERVNKISNYLIEQGFDVTVFGFALKNTHYSSQKYTIVRKKLFFNNKVLFYAEYNIRLFLFLLKNRYPYILANDLDTLPACYFSSLIFKSRLIYDSHEYYTEVPELENRPFVKNVWKSIEQFILPKLKFTMTVSETIALEYKKKYGIEMEVLRNMPRRDKLHNIIDVRIPTKNKFILYQGMLNPGRGLKPMIEALHLLNDIDLVIVGYGKVQQELEDFVSNMKLNNRVHFVGRVPNNELINYCHKASIGMVLEEPMGNSFKYCLPNKLFDFINAELPILASPLVEVKKIVDTYGVGLLIENHSPKEIADKIAILLTDKALVENMVVNQKKFKEQFYWEKEVLNVHHFFDINSN